MSDSKTTSSSCDNNSENGSKKNSDKRSDKPSAKSSAPIDLSKIPFYLSQPHPCSYLDNQLSTSLFADPNNNIEPLVYSQLSEFGFRRSGKLVYKPRCESCNACIPVRVLVNKFQLSRSQKRCLKRNTDLTLKIVNTINTNEHYALFEQYINQRHDDGSMYPASRSQFNDFLACDWAPASYVEFRDKQKKLIALAVTDVLENGLSAVYTYFDPSHSKRSIGIYGVLKQIELAKKYNKEYLYLGYWIKECQKMSYKINYQPFQLLINNQWVNIQEN